MQLQYFYPFLRVWKQLSSPNAPNFLLNPSQDNPDIPGHQVALTDDLNMATPSPSVGCLAKIPGPDNLEPHPLESNQENTMLRNE